MTFAGFWEGCKWPDGAISRPFTMITTEANGIVGKLHDRMPVIIKPDNWPTCLGDPATLLTPAGDDVLKVWPVSEQVNSPKNNGAELLETVR